jgi:hypothetical protein
MIFYIPTRIYHHCQEIKTKHYIVVIKKAGAWGRWCVDCLPFYEIEKLLKFLQISFGNHKNSGT